jgi:hypothetical protein
VKVSGWQPEGAPDEVTFGPDGRGWSPPRPRVLVLLLLVAALLVGALIGAALVGGLDDDRRSGAGQRTVGEPGTIAAAPVVRIDGGGRNGPAFGLPLRNDGDEAVEVTEFRFPDLRSELVSFEGTTLAPGVWTTLRFAAPVDCLAGATGPLATVELTLDGDRRDGVPLPGSGEEIAGYHAIMCEPQTMPDRADLLGVWVLEEAYGSQFLVRSMMWRFERDGTYTADPEGRVLLDVPHGVDGRYSLARGKLLVDATGGYGCGGDHHNVWRPSLLEGYLGLGQGRPRLSVTWLAGTCPGGMTDQVWVFRRLIDVTAGG